MVVQVELAGMKKSDVEIVINERVTSPTPHPSCDV